MADQPELRSYIVYDRLPAGHIAHTMLSTEVMPHIRPGERAVIDLSQREPVGGDLFLIEYQSGPVDRRRHVVETYYHEKMGGWVVGPLERRRIVTLAGAPDPDIPAVRWVDGPYRPGCLAEKLVGRVVGILTPTFEEPRRLPSPD